MEEEGEARECMHTQTLSRLSLTWWVMAGASFDLDNHSVFPEVTWQLSFWKDAKLAFAKA